MNEATSPANPRPARRIQGNRSGFGNLGRGDAAALNVACQVAVAVPALQVVPVPTQLPLALKLMMANVGSKPPGPSSTFLWR